jgi:hypothetical protein
MHARSGEDLEVRDVIPNSVHPDKLHFLGAVRPFLVQFCQLCGYSLVLWLKLCTWCWCKKQSKHMHERGGRQWLTSAVRASGHVKKREDSTILLPNESVVVVSDQIDNVRVGLPGPVFLHEIGEGEGVMKRGWALDQRIHHEAMKTRTDRKKGIVIRPPLSGSPLARWSPANALMASDVLTFLSWYMGFAWWHMHQTTSSRT